MSEITLSEEQLEELANKIVEKMERITKQKEEVKIKTAVNRAKAERQCYPIKLM